MCTCLSFDDPKIVPGRVCESDPLGIQSGGAKTGCDREILAGCNIQRTYIFIVERGGLSEPDLASDSGTRINLYLL